METLLGKRFKSISSSPGLLKCNQGIKKINIKIQNSQVILKK